MYLWRRNHTGRGDLTVEARPTATECVSAKERESRKRYPSTDCHPEERSDEGSMYLWRRNHTGRGDLTVGAAVYQPTGRHLS
jgi:hypothetical protein